MDKVYYNVKNRSAGMVYYKIPEMGIAREYAPGEVKKVGFDELEKLSFIPGGRELMTDYLQIQSDNVIEDLGIHKEPEYDMSEADVVELMQNGSLDSFLDCLDYAPAGIIDLIKQLAVSLPLNDAEKRAALKKVTGFDTTKALVHVEESKEDEQSTKSSAPATGRRVQPKQTESGRRTTPKYNVVKKEMPK